MDVERNEVYITNRRKSRRLSGLLRKPINHQDNSCVEISEIRKTTRYSVSRNGQTSTRSKEISSDVDKENIGENSSESNRSFTNSKNRKTVMPVGELADKMGKLDLKTIQEKTAELLKSKVDIDELLRAETPDDEKNATKNSILVDDCENHEKTNKKIMKSNKHCLSEPSPKKATPSNRKTQDSDAKFKSHVLNKINWLQDQTRETINSMDCKSNVAILNKNPMVVLEPLHNDILQILQKTKENNGKPTTENVRNRRFSDRIKQQEIKPNYTEANPSFVTTRLKKDPKQNEQSHGETNKEQLSKSCKKHHADKLIDSKLNNIGKSSKSASKHKLKSDNETDAKKILDNKSELAKRLAYLDDTNEMLYYYLNENEAKTHKSTSLETIYEEPRCSKGSVSFMSTSKYKRFINFSDNDNILRIKKQTKRLKKAKEIVKRCKNKYRMKVSDEYFKTVLKHLE